MENAVTLELGMERDDYLALSSIGQALWAESDRSQRMALDTYSAVALLGLDGEKVLEKTAQALLQRAVNDGTSATAPGVQQGFYRLSAEERLILSALHHGKWGYARLARILGVSELQVAELAWGARLDLATTPGFHRLAPHPSGSSHHSSECPEYNTSRPWTQAFLDQELSGRERLFLQQHVLQCQRCQNALSSARQLYYDAANLVPQAPAGSSWLGYWQQVDQAAELRLDPSKITLGQSLRIFLGREETRWLIFLFVCCWVAFSLLPISAIQ